MGEAWGGEGGGRVRSGGKEKKRKKERGKEKGKIIHVPHIFVYRWDFYRYYSLMGCPLRAHKMFRDAS